MLYDDFVANVTTLNLAVVELAKRVAALQANALTPAQVVSVQTALSDATAAVNAIAP